MRVLVFGDSIAQGFWDSQGGWVERLRKHYDSLALADLKKNKQPEIFNLGVSGDTTRNLLARIEAETKIRRWPDDPLIVVVAIGTNDDLFESDKQYVPPDEFKANLEQIVSILKPLTQGILLVGNPACDESKTMPVFWGDFTYTNKELQRSEHTIVEVAAKNNLPCVPIFEVFKLKLDEGVELLADGLHPNDEGHQFIANQVKPQLEYIIKQ
jgi:lysophospholipase L1-like esterase